MHDFIHIMYRVSECPLNPYVVLPKHKHVGEMVQTEWMAYVSELRVGNQMIYHTAWASSSHLAKLKQILVVELHVLHASSYNMEHNFHL